MIDETNAAQYVREPSESNLQFRSKQFLYEHVRKHVFSRDEKWIDLDGFDSRQMKIASEIGEDSALWAFAKEYQSLLSNRALECCRENRNHIHLLSIYPEMTQELLGLIDREPVQIIKCWGILENLVIILFSTVINDDFGPYVISTGYRTFPKLKKERWFKKERSRAAELAEIRGGKRQILIADHIE